MVKGMIDVGKKDITERTARAQAVVKLTREIITVIRKNKNPKGNVLENARVAGIMAAKKTAELIPLCHTLALEYANVQFFLQQDRILIESTVRATAKTGVEMEALLAATVAALTIYDMSKIYGQRIEVADIYLLEKIGGRSGHFKRS